MINALLVASLVLMPAERMFDEASISRAIAATPQPPIQICLSEEAMTHLLVTKPDKVQFKCVDQATMYFSVLKGDGIARTFYDAMALSMSHTLDLISTKKRLDDPSGDFEEGFQNRLGSEFEFLFKDVEGLMLAKLTMTITATVASAIRNRPSIEYHQSGGATVTKGKGSKWGTRVAVAINLAAFVSNLLLRK